MGYSVLQVGLLPQRIWTNKDAAGVEISGLGGAEGQLSPQPLPVWEGEGTDQMRRAYKRLSLGGSQHRPILNGTKVDPLDYVDDLTSGFCNLYRLLITYRTELLAEDGPLARFKDDTTRVVARPTRIYQLLLENSNHPDRLRNALERDRLFDKLWFEIKQRPFLARLIAAERYDLHRGDFPIFTARPASTTLWTSTGQPLVDFLREPALTQVQRRLQAMGEADLTRQLWFIRASLAILATGNESQVQGGHAIAKPAGAEEVSREKLLVEARAIGDRLEALALWGEQDVTWIGLSLENLASWNLAPLNLSLYDGLPGVALFLAYLGDYTGETRYSILARAALANIRRQIELKKVSLPEIGGFEGWGGVIYTLSHLSKLWNDPTLLDEAENLTELLPPLIEKDIHLDFLTGTAGCISALLSLYHCRPSEQTLAVARRGGEYLLARAAAQKVGVAWQTPMPASQPAIGLGRGSTGMGYVLLQLAAVTGDPRFGEVGRAALAYERSVFSPVQNNWPDFRTFGKDPLPAGTFRYMSAWCHGAPGIGLARQALMTNYSDPAIRAEVEAAVRNTLEKGYGANHSLCHGDMGNLDLLVEVSRKFKDSQLAGEVQHWTTAILADVEQRGWICSNPLGVETPGFMVGLAGIGYELLRLADPERLPSALILEPPR
jgi:type 2 lantibiotic biosynthesis protein LanM